MKTLVINLLGAAGSGKSTLATKVFTTLKMKGYNCEYVSEYAKQIVYEENYKKLNNQLLIFSNQYYNLDLLRDKVDIIVTDSPMLLSIFYNKNFNKKNPYQIPNKILEDLVLYCHSTFDNLNYFIKRNHEYKKEGRYQTEEQAKVEEKQLLDLLNSLNVSFDILSSTDDCASKIVDGIEKRCEFYNNIKKAGKEIERKFLLQDLPANLKKLKKDFILQGYINSEQGEKRIRNVNNKKFYINEKYGQGIVRDEVEKEISKAKFLELFKDTKGKIIKKIRYYYPLAGDKTAEIDCYYGKLKGLNVAEVEFKSIEEAEKFEKPKWFGDDVTFEKEFKNYSLSSLENYEELEI